MTDLEAEAFTVLTIYKIAETPASALKELMRRMHSRPARRRAETLSAEERAQRAERLSRFAQSQGRTRPISSLSKLSSSLAEAGLTAMEIARLFDSLEKLRRSELKALEQRARAAGIHDRWKTFRETARARGEKGRQAGLTDLIASLAPQERELRSLAAEVLVRLQEPRWELLGVDPDAARGRIQRRIDRHRRRPT